MVDERKHVKMVESPVSNTQESLAFRKTKESFVKSNIFHMSSKKKIIPHASSMSVANTTNLFTDSNVDMLQTTHQVVTKEMLEKQKNKYKNKNKNNKSRDCKDNDKNNNKSHADYYLLDSQNTINTNTSLNNDSKRITTDTFSEDTMLMDSLDDNSVAMKVDEPNKIGDDNYANKSNSSCNKNKNSNRTSTEAKVESETKTVVVSESKFNSEPYNCHQNSNNINEKKSYNHSNEHIVNVTKSSSDNSNIPEIKVIESDLHYKLKLTSHTREKLKMADDAKLPTMKTAKTPEIDTTTVENVKKTNGSSSGNHKVNKNNNNNNNSYDIYQHQLQHHHQQQQEKRKHSEHLLKSSTHNQTVTLLGIKKSSLTTGAVLRATTLVDDMCHHRSEPTTKGQREMISPRCHSRESNPGDVRCSSNESQCSGNGGVTPETTPLTNTLSTASLPSANSVALLPQQSAAMAAYLNVAAVAAAQQNQLLLTNPLAAAASLVQATQSQSPNESRQTSSSSPNNVINSSVLDFSTKHVRQEYSDNGSDDDENFSKKYCEDVDDEGVASASEDDVNSPLDLSVSAFRKRTLTDSESIFNTNKVSRPNDFKSLNTSITWVPPINPYLAAVAAANISPKAPKSLKHWSKKPKIIPNEATKALEKMTEMTRLGSVTESDASNRQVTSTSSSNSAHGSNGRHSAWQSHWLNKGAIAVKDVFKCVWCKQSFPTLASLTTHMKETQHCGVNVPPTSGANDEDSSITSNTNGNHTIQSTPQTRNSILNSFGNNLSSSTTSHSSNKSDLNLLIKETMPLPRKLVRGQDVWLGKGAEQTRQILKCMWCGQSFRSLAEMTSHMQETQHYTNIISQEQIISWKTSDDKSSNGVSTPNGTTSSPTVVSPNLSAQNTGNQQATNVSSSAINAVLTCKVCDEAFSTLKELSNHIVKNSHFKEHIMRSVGENNNSIRRGRQTREKRKKSLPVRKLLEIERAQHDFKNCLDPALKPLRDFAASTKITCEKCNEKIETAMFVDHIRQCLGGTISMPRNNNNATNMKSDQNLNTKTTKRLPDERNTMKENFSSLSSRSDILCPLTKENTEKSNSTPSVLNALEQLIEKSFDTRSRHSKNSFDNGSANCTPLGSSILKRLGIDDSVDYTKPLMDSRTTHFLRSYSNYSSRDRSASESSSMSEQCSSRLESETPERISEHSRQVTPCQTPDKMTTVNDVLHSRKDQMEINRIKYENFTTTNNKISEVDFHDLPQKISVKKEFSTASVENRILNIHEVMDLEVKQKLQTPEIKPISPTKESSLHSKSPLIVDEKENPPAKSSLNALSSMFANLDNVKSSLSNNGVSTLLSETNNNNVSSGKKTNANPLAALQKLCENTDPPAANTCSSASNITHMNPHNIAAPNQNNNCSSGSMVAFSWACNDAVMTSDSIIKCSFCDTPFCSKGAYRHHLSKVHFVKSDSVADSDSQASMSIKSPEQTTSPKSLFTSPKSSSKSPLAHQQISSPSTSTPNAVIPSTINPFEESSQSKFLKYTELAKQLSSKNV